MKNPRTIKSHVATPHSLCLSCLGWLSSVRLAFWHIYTVRMDTDFTEIPGFGLALSPDTEFLSGERQQAHY